MSPDQAEPAAIPVAQCPSILCILGAGLLLSTGEKGMSMELTKGKRIVALGSAIWLAIIFVLCLNGAESFRRNPVSRESERYVDFVEFVSTFMVFGVVPVLILWGIVWIRGAPERKRPE